ncbi:MAG: hypothetical protein NZ524_09940 [Thiobacillaceae bacterium]|nr:hypothetical protein [Thiobacillaceae bacterium]MCX7672287.1 hypothetical protein [Thiobacillaceae bacterium]MDW8322684.1 hypothetical protein [Burkholderiales bacterium]
MDRNELLAAVDAALAGDWHRAHRIVQQDERDPLACWIHAVLHKIEGDAWNSRYWYARSPHRYEDWPRPEAELRAIRARLLADGAA